MNALYVEDHFLDGQAAKEFLAPIETAIDSLLANYEAIAGVKAEFYSFTSGSLSFAQHLVGLGVTAAEAAYTALLSELMLWRKYSPTYEIFGLDAHDNRIEAIESFLDKGHPFMSSVGPPQGYCNSWLIYFIIELTYGEQAAEAAIQYVATNFDAGRNLVSVVGKVFTPEELAELNDKLFSVYAAAKSFNSTALMRADKKKFAKSIVLAGLKLASYSELLAMGEELENKYAFRILRAANLLINDRNNVYKHLLAGACLQAYGLDVFDRVELLLSSNKAILKPLDSLPADFYEACFVYVASIGEPTDPIDWIVATDGRLKLNEVKL